MMSLNIKGGFIANSVQIFSIQERTFHFGWNGMSLG